MGLEWDSDGRRYAVVRVAEQWKGSALPLSTLAPSLASGQEFRVATLERRFNHGTIIERTLGAPDYRRGQDVVLFVKPWGSAQNYLPMGLMQGVFLIERVGSLERVRSRAAHDGTHLPKIDGSHLQVKSESEENYLHDISKDWGDLDSFRKKVKSL